MKEGEMAWRLGRTWYQVSGSLLEQEPLVVLHGGPGFPHNYLLVLSKLAKQLPVIFYDQIGCGRSFATIDEDWSVDVFVEELEALRKELGQERMHLLGHSWGGSLAVEYALAFPEHVSSLILSSPLFDSKLWVEQTEILQRAMPGGETMLRHQRDGTTDSKEYKALDEEFLRRYDCSLSPLPEEMLAARAGFGEDVYNSMWGPSESYATGVLKDWSCLSRLAEIKTPVLVTSGSSDSATPVQVAAGVLRLQDVRWRIFPGGTHNLHMETPGAYLEELSYFLK